MSEDSIEWWGKLLVGFLIGLVIFSLVSCTASKDFGMRVGTDADYVAETGPGGSISITPDGIQLSGPVRLVGNENQSAGFKTAVDGTARAIGYAKLAEAFKGLAVQAGGVIRAKEVTARVIDGNATSVKAAAISAQTDQARIAAEAAAAE